MCLNRHNQPNVLFLPLMIKVSLHLTSGRILSIAWYNGPQGENQIITGGMDNIRIWSVKSGHAIQRLTLPRSSRNKETIVWAIAVTRWVPVHAVSIFSLHSTLADEVQIIF